MKSRHLLRNTTLATIIALGVFGAGQKCAQMVLDGKQYKDIYEQQLEGMTGKAYGDVPRDATGDPMFKPQAPAQPRIAYPDCGQRFNDIYWNDLEKEERLWSLLYTESIFNGADLDGDGKKDTVIMTSGPAFKPCSIKYEWMDKKTTFSIDFTSEKDYRESIIGGITKEYDINPATKEYTLRGVDWTGREWSETKRWNE